MPIILSAIIVTAIIAINIEPEEKITDPNRPLYLLNNDEIPEDWFIDLEMEIDGKYYVQINTPEPKAFSVETINFNAEDKASDYVDLENMSIQSSELEYRFYKNKVDLDPLDNGYTWEIKSPCCYSRGVTFSIGSIYIHIFGSQDSTWEDIEYLYNAQITNVYDYLGKHLPDNFVGNSTTETTDFPVAILLISISMILSLRRLGRRW